MYLLEKREAVSNADAMQLWAQQRPHMRIEALRHIAVKKELRPAQVREYPKHKHIFNPPLPRQQRAVLQTRYPLDKGYTCAGLTYRNAGTSARGVTEEVSQCNYVLTQYVEAVSPLASLSFSEVR